MTRPAEDSGRPARMPVPPVLTDLTGWGWRLLLLGFLAYLLLRIALDLYLVSVSVAAALLVTALLSPLAHGLRRRGVPRALATAVTVILALTVLGAALVWVVARAVGQAPVLITQLQQSIQDLPISNELLQQVRNQVADYLQTQSGSLASGVLTGVQTLGKLLTGAILTLLLTVILLADGDRMWSWLVTRLPERAQPRLAQAGHPAWARLAGWIRGTFLIATFHGVVVGATLWLLGTPLVAPLAVLVFIGSFIPLFGALIFGGISVLVTLATQGLAAAIVLLAVLIVANQIEAHVLQPFLVGRYVRLHPFVVAVVITSGTLVAGLAGALLAVPLTAAVYAALTSGAQPVHPRVRRTWGRRVSARAAGAGRSE